MSKITSKTKELFCLIVTSALILVFSAYSYTKVGVSVTSIVLSVLAILQILLGLKFKKFALVLVAFESFFVGIVGLFLIAVTLPESQEEIFGLIPDWMRYILAAISFLFSCWFSSFCLNLSKGRL